MMVQEAGCIFCRIVAGEIPCWTVYEDERVLAFLDVGPLSPGHTLVIPKNHAATLDGMSDEDAAAIGAVLPRLGRAVQEASNAPGWNLLQNNGKVAHQVVMHVHFHIIPRGLEVDGFGMKWDPAKLNEGDAKVMQSQVRRYLG